MDVVLRVDRRSVSQAILTTSTARTTPHQKPRGLSRIIFLPETTGSRYSEVVIGTSSCQQFSLTL